MIIVIVTLMIMAVVTGAGVFEVVAGGAVSEVQVELLADFLGVLTDLDGNDDWKIVALQKALSETRKFPSFLNFIRIGFLRSPAMTSTLCLARGMALPWSSTAEILTLRSLVTKNSR